MWMGRRRTPGRDAWGQLTIEDGLEGREGSRAGLGVPRASPEVSFLFGLLSFSEGPTGLPDRARTGPNIISLRRETGALVQTRTEGRRIRAQGWGSGPYRWRTCSEPKLRPCIAQTLQTACRVRAANAVAAMAVSEAPLQ